MNFVEQVTSFILVTGFQKNPEESRENLAMKLDAIAILRKQNPTR